APVPRRFPLAEKEHPGRISQWRNQMRIALPARNWVLRVGRNEKMQHQRRVLERLFTPGHRAAVPARGRARTDGVHITRVQKRGRCMEVRQAQERSLARTKQIEWSQLLTAKAPRARRGNSDE